VSCDLLSAPEQTVTPKAKKTNRAVRRAAKSVKNPAAA
jgi:hypothetical protein